MQKTKIYHVYKPGTTAHYIEADRIKLAKDHILFSNTSEGVLGVVATSPGLVIIDQQSERGAAGFPR
jgi:hypothetical protein